MAFFCLIVVRIQTMEIEVRQTVTLGKYLGVKTHSSDLSVRQYKTAFENK